MLHAPAKGKHSGKGGGTAFVSARRFTSGSRVRAVGQAHGGRSPHRSRQHNTKAAVNAAHGSKATRLAHAARSEQQGQRRRGTAVGGATAERAATGSARGNGLRRWRTSPRRAQRPPDWRASFSLSGMGHEEFAPAAVSLPPDPPPLRSFPHQRAIKNSGALLFLLAHTARGPETSLSRSLCSPLASTSFSATATVLLENGNAGSNVWGGGFRCRREESLASAWLYFCSLSSQPVCVPVRSFLECSLRALLPHRSRSPPVLCRKGARVFGTGHREKPARDPSLAGGKEDKLLPLSAGGCALDSVRLAFRRCLVSSFSSLRL
ncbi:hypothetical protein MRX96_057694 [Rhipicephalus microplus]